MRTVFWEDHQVKMIDQRRLPNALEVVACQTHTDVARAIQNMTIRGAPAGLRPPSGSKSLAAA